MTRIYGRALQGKRCHDHAPAGHWKTTTILGSIRLSGEIESILIEGALNREFFDYYIENILAPTLREGDILVMDNLNTHKSEKVIKLLSDMNVEVRFLPAYSPDLNPIEKMWSKLKSLLRTAKARTLDTLNAATAMALDKITQLDALGWFQSSGYCF